MKKIPPRKLKLSDFFQADPVPRSAFKSIKTILKNGSLFRYIGGKPSDSETALLENDFKKYLNVKYALALNSCSSAMYIALLCCGVKQGDEILVPAFTFTSVPSAIIHAGAKPILVECDERYCLDIDDFKNKISKKTKVLLLSHMRGHTSDLDKISMICKQNNITLIEDAAHSLGVLWRKKHVGTFGKVGCYSFQSYKIINSGEGGLLVTNDADIIVKAIFLSGAYEQMYKMHFVKNKLFKKYQNIFPVLNLRMNNVSAAIIRSQLSSIEKKVAIYNKNYNYIYNKLSKSPNIVLPKTDPRERMAPDSIQFNLIGISKQQAINLMLNARKSGISLYILGAHKNNARVFWNWKFIKQKQKILKTKNILEFLCDIRIPIKFKKPDLDYISNTILQLLSNFNKYE